MCWYAPDLGAVFSGDTLFNGGPGATGRSYSDFPTILASISERLGKLPADTVVYTGHGDTTAIGDETRELRRMGRARAARRPSSTRFFSACTRPRSAHPNHAAGQAY